MGQVFLELYPLLAMTTMSTIIITFFVDAYQMSDTTLDVKHILSS